MKVLKLWILFLLVPVVSWSYTSSEFESDLSGFLTTHNQMIAGMVSSYQIMKKNVPLFPKYDGIMTSVDLSYGACTSPFFEYQNKVSNLKAFADPNALFQKSGLSIKDIHVNAGFAFPDNNLLFFVNAGGINDFSQTNIYNMNVGGELYYRLIDEEFSLFGVFVGSGYDYSSGRVDNAVSSTYIDYIDSSTNTWNGNISGNWSLNSANVELFLYKTLLLFNFYSRLTGSYTFGNAHSVGTGSFNGNSVSRELDTTIGAYNFQVSGGMEISFGPIGLNVEAGRSWLNGSVYGNVGLRTMF